MDEYLLDTNVISEVVRPSPNPGVVTFLSELNTGWLSVITIHEIEYGMRLLPAGQKRTRLESSVERLLDQYQQFILPAEEKVAISAAKFRAGRRSQGRALHLSDALIAATAENHRLTLVTRNADDFWGLDIAMHNPWIENR